MRIQIDDVRGEDVAALISEHLQNMRAISPPESTHALPLDELRHSSVTFYTAWIDDQLAGCGALKDLGDGISEIKTMRTRERHLRKGVAAAVLEVILAEAKKRNYRRVSLETGATDAFLPARRLYERYGFVCCGPFADYKLDPHSVFMTLELAESAM